MLLHFPKLRESHPHIIQEALKVGKFDGTKMYIELPDDFNFGDNKPDSYAVTMSNPEYVNYVINKEWPLHLKPMKLLAKEGDKGLGDIVERVIGVDNSIAIKLWFAKHFNKDCGCSARKEWLNSNYPL